MPKHESRSGPRDRYAKIPLSDLRIGARLRSPIFDPRSERDILFLNAGAVITSTQLHNLKQRGISHVRVLRSELSRLSRSGNRNANQDVTESGDEKDNRFIRKVKRHSSSYDVHSIERVTNKYRQSVAETRALFANLKSGDDVDGNAVITSAHQSLLQMTDDFDLYVSLGITSTTDGYPHTHSVKSQRLAMAIGVTMGLSEKELMELGLGCLVHDVGMLRVDHWLYESPRALSPVEFLQVTKHPGYTFDMIEHIAELPVGSRMVAYQLHERWNGSGYPRHREGRQIHPLARIATVADVFVAMISDRPHRAAMLPYHAIQEILVETNRGLFDPNVVRHLLLTLSLFPIGSHIEMSDGRVGKVIRANGDQYARPIVELWSPETGESEFEVVDLSRDVDESELFVVRPIPRSKSQTPEAEEAKDSARQLSFYGVGSYVELSDGRIAKVMRVNLRQFTQPVIKLRSPVGVLEGELVDLSSEPDGSGLQIKRPIARPQPIRPQSEEDQGPPQQLSFDFNAE